MRGIILDAKTDEDGGLKLFVKNGETRILETDMPAGLAEGGLPPRLAFFVERGLYASQYYEFEEKKGRLAGFKKTEDKPVELKACAFDIEVYNKRGTPNADKDAVIMIGAYDGRPHCFYWTPQNGSEEKMIQDFTDFVKKEDFDVLVSYNGSNFDFPYLKKRCRRLGIKLGLGRDGSEVELRRGGVYLKASVFGRPHIDAFDSVEFLTGIGAMRLPSNDLDTVYKALFGKDKIKIEGSRLYEYWEKGGESLELLKEYNKQDTTATYEIGKEVLPLFLELSKIIGMPLFEVARMSASQMVEWLLVREAHGRGQPIPPKVDEDEARHRIMRPIAGAFVKEPEPGLHERVAVCDFKSMYPSFILAHNISPDTLNCECCKDAHVAPEVGHRFCRKNRGLVPAVLEELLKARAETKKKMKELDKKSAEHRSLHFKQWALKIVANAVWGYCGYSRARWYCREAAESITAWGRYYLQEVMRRAEEDGFWVLYGDTDGCFLKLKKDQRVDDVKKFVDKVNRSLPEQMELEFDGYYPRCVFVATRGGGKAAKKRYALIREDGVVEIVGFEFVRRDWANIAKKAQEQVIEAVLREGKPEKAVQAVKKIIKDLREKKVSTEDLKIYTQITRPLSSYEQQAPHVKAAKRLVQAGFRVPAGSLLEYVVVKGQGQISDRSIPLQLLGPQQEYDAEYYVYNQVLPAVVKILTMLGVSEEDLAEKTKQKGLGDWA